MKPGIYLEITPIPTGYNDYKHSYLIYRKADGTSEVIRGGPDIIGGLRIDVETGKPLEQSKDRYEPGEDAGTRPSKRLDIPDDKLDESWSKMRGKAEEIDKSKLPYRSDNEADDPDQTSNSITRAALDAINYPIEKALPEGTDIDKMPGIKDNLEDELRQHREQAEKDRAEAQEQAKKDQEEARKDREEAGGLSGAIGGWPGEEPKTGKPDQKTTPQEQDRGGLGKEAAANQKALDAQKEEDRVPAAGVKLPQNEPMAGSDNAQTKEAEPPMRPDIQKLRDEMLKPGKPVDDILLKKPEDWTEGEVREVMKERLRLPMNNPERPSLWNSEKKWFKHFYGDGNAKADEFGKIADPKPIRRMIDKPLDARTADGRPLSKEISRFSKHLSGAAGDVPAPELVKSLQSGLNTLGMSKRWNSKNAPGLAGGGRMLKEDGVFGPKTRGGLKTAMARLGRPKLEEGAALGRFGTFAASNRPRSFRDLRDTTERSFGPLFRNPGKPVGVESKLEATSLQETLNDLGPKHLGQGFTPLKLDGDIGPRTFDAFSRINKAAGPRSLTERFGSFLGFL